MRIEIDKTSILFIREDGDPKFYGVKEAKGESNLFHWIKKQLANGHPDLPKNFPTDWIKKRMWKDGHMMDDMQQYLRTRKPVIKSKGVAWHVCLYNGMWAIQGAEYYWNDGSVRLIMETVSICKPELNIGNPEAIADQSQKVWEQIGVELGITA